ncbi:MAG: hypothetical protein JRD05_04430 [Deltaproteobacteria bacterium]|nr:hypothetical protein [Deltaproteobacteria bacterium]
MLQNNRPEDTPPNLSNTTFVYISKQSPKMKKILLTAGKEASEHCRKFILAKEDGIKKDMVKKGMQIYDPANNEKEFIEKATKQVWPKFYKSVGGKDKVEAALKILGREFPF